LREVFDMPATHYAAWEKHLAEFPPGDFLTQRLVAELIQTVEAFMCGFAGKDSKPRKLAQIAPWLDTPAVKRARERRAVDKHRQAVSAIIAAQGDE